MELKWELLRALKDLHSDVVSLVECIEECEDDGGQSYDTSKTRRLLGQAQQVIAKGELEHAKEFAIRR